MRSCAMRTTLVVMIVSSWGAGCGGGGSTSLAEFLPTYCAWSSRCDEINVVECVGPFQGDSGRSWIDANASMASNVRTCLEDANDCNDYGDCTADMELPDCGLADPASCPGDDGTACTGVACTAVARVNVCFNGGDLDIDCFKAGVNCVEQTVSGHFCE